MAHGGTDKYYNPDNKVVNDGDIAYANDLNALNYAVDASLEQVAEDMDALELITTTVVNDSQEWASNNQGVLPDPLVLNTYSAKAYSIEALDSAQNTNDIIRKADGTTLTGAAGRSASTSATNSQASAVSSASSAVTATTQAGIATTQAGISTTKAGEAAASAVLADASADAAAVSEFNADASADAAAASAAAFTAANLLTSIKTVDGTGSGLDADLLDGQHGAYYAPIASPTLTGIPAAPTASLDTNTTQVATTQFVLNQAYDSNPVMDGVANPGASERYARGNHIHPNDTTKANLDGGATFTGTITLPSTTSIGTVSDTEIGYLDGVTSGVQAQINLKAPTNNPTLTGTVTLPAATSIGTVSNTEIGYLDGVTSALQAQLNLKAPLSSPTFTGVPSAPTATVGTDTTQIATTQFVNDVFGEVVTGFRNKIINGAMLVDQRNAGVAQTITAGAALAYTVDRFYAFCTGANVTGQQVAGLVANTKRYQFTGLAGVTGVGFGTRLEAVNTARLASKACVLQAKLASTSLTAITWTAYYATTLDTFGTLASPTRTQIATGVFTINSTETKYSALMAVPTEATTGIEIVFTGGALLGSQTLTIGDVQLEVGSIASEFEDVGYSEYLRSCQRYFQWITTSTYFYAYSIGEYYATTLVFPTKMRAIPSYSTPAADPDGTPSATNLSNVTGSNPSTTCIMVVAQASAVGNASTYYYRISLTAEL